MIRTSVSCQGIREDIFEHFHFRGHFPLKSEIESRSNRHFTQSRLHVTRRSFRDRSTFLYDVRLRSYGASKLPNFRILAYLPNTKPLKRTFRRPAYSPGVTSQNDSDFSMWYSRKSERVPSGSAVFLRLLVGELGTPKLAQSFAYGKWLYSYRMLLHGASDLDQRCLKTRNSKDGCTFPPNIFAHIPKITFLESSA